MLCILARYVRHPALEVDETLDAILPSDARQLSPLTRLACTYGGGPLTSTLPRWTDLQQLTLRNVTDEDGSLTAALHALPRLELLSLHDCYGMQWWHLQACVR